MMQATGTGSLPGTDMPGALRHVLGGFERAWLPELPARGVAAGMVGRTAAMLDGLGLDLQPQGWRLGEHPGIDHHRAHALLRQDLDELEEHAQSSTGRLALTACGPWTLAALVERPRGDKVLADHGARRELAQSLGSGLSALLAEVGRRLPHLQLEVQLDEPLLPAVLAGQVPTASGFSRLRSVDRAAASELLSAVVEDCHREVDLVRLHCCAPGLDLEIASRCGVDELGLDARLLGPADWDVLGPWLEAGCPLVLGLAPSHRLDHVLGPDELVRRGLEVLRPLGIDPALLHEHLTISTACGLAGWSVPTAAAQLDALLEAAPLLDEQLAR